MTDDVVISVRKIGKRYQRYTGMRERLIHQLFPDRARTSEEIWALKDISFEIKQGESVAIIGRNGGGKSTLLQILTGTLTPTEGEVEVRGRICALLELGSGFNPDYSGRDNVMMNGLLLGLSRQQILDRFDEIAAFAEIGDAIERPVKTYSSGMMLRLAFAVQVLADPDILIIDEALSVGDFFFQQKCLSFIRSLKEKGVTLLFVSHDMGAVRDTCERGILLRKGRVNFDGENLEAIRRYLIEDNENILIIQNNDTYNNKEFLPQSENIIEGAIWIKSSINKYEKQAVIDAVGLENALGAPTSSILMGEDATFKVQYEILIEGKYHIHLQIKNKNNQIVTATGSYNLGVECPFGTETEKILFSLTSKMSLEAGEYSFSISITQPFGNSGKIIDETPWIGPISIHWDYNNIPKFYGLVGLETEANFRPIN